MVVACAAACAVGAGWSVTAGVGTPPPRPPPRVTEGCVQLAGGTFTMGSPAGEGNDNERPQYQVTVAPFCIDRTEVTVGAYRAGVTAGRCEAPTAYDTDRSRSQYFCNWGREGAEGHPVNCVTAANAGAFCVSRGGHLPTEDPWEFATRGTAWSFLTGIQNWTDPWGTTAPVADLPRAGDTPEGLIGMADNVLEWTRNPYGRYTARAGNATEYTGVDRNSRMLRGGGWDSIDPASAGAALRNGPGATLWVGSVGFRCVTEGR